MVYEKYPEDKELGRGGRAEQHRLDSSDTHVSPTRSTRQIAFLLILLWTCWIIGCISDTLLSIYWATVTYTRMTPLQHWIYYRSWDLWLYRHDPWHVLEGQRLRKINVGSLTLCAMLVMALVNALRDVNDDLSLAVTNTVITLFIAGGAWIGAAEREVALIAMPFGWLLATTVRVILNRAGMKDLGKLLKVSERVGRWASSVSLAMFLAVHVWVYGFGNEFVLFAFAWLGIGFVYRWLG